MVLLETRGLWLYSIVRGGIGCLWRLACIKHGPNWPMDTSPRNRASREPDGPPLGMISHGENKISARGAHAACDFKWLASKCTSFFQTINVIAAIFLAKVKRAIVGFLP